jgi:hypothetical protein
VSFLPIQPFADPQRNWFIRAVAIDTHGEVCEVNSPPFWGKPAGWPWVIAHPGLPQIRTCPIKAYGSSSHGLACPTVHRMDHDSRGKRKTFQNPTVDDPRKEALPSPA